MIFIIGLSLIFMYLTFHSLIGPNRTGKRFDSYFFTVLTLTIVTSSVPIRHVMFQNSLSDAVEELLGKESVYVDCNSYFDSIFHFNLAGFVYRGSSTINLEVRSCKNLKSYLKNPSEANSRELFALHVLTHEAMHVAGEFNEALADCQAFQRNHRMAELLGVPSYIAAKNAADAHRTRSKRHPYYSPQCEPGMAMDERLPNAVWVGSEAES